MEYKTVGGVVLAIVTLLSGSLLYIEKTDDYHNCRAKWIDNFNGTYTCPKDSFTDKCHSIEDRGNGWYRCYIGKVYVPPEVIDDGKVRCDLKSISNKCN